MIKKEGVGPISEGDDRDEGDKGRETNVNVDKLAAVRARNSLLDDGVLGHPLVDGGEAVK